MTKYIPILLLAFLLIPAGPARGGEGGAMARAEIMDAAGRVVGHVAITEDDAVSISYSLVGLPPGLHAFHIHEKGECEPPFKSAGGHFNPFGKKHGLKNPEGPHAGDLENISVGADGVARGTLSAPLVTLKPGANSLFKEGGTAIVIHEGPDDYMSDPAGAAGSRIACGVIRRAE